jgi:hypothetical protein
MAAFGSNRAGVFVTPAPGERGSNRTVVALSEADQKAKADADKAADKAKTKAKKESAPAKTKAAKNSK